MSSDSDDRTAVAEIQLLNDADVPDIKTLLAALEQVFELEAAFQDGQISVYRSGRPIDELMDGMEQAVRDAAAGNTVTSDELRETLDGDDTGTDDASDEQENTDAETDDSEASESSIEDDADGDTVPCDHCGQPCKNNTGRAAHERHCDENPANSSGDETEAGEDAQDAADGDAGEDEETTVSCEFCGEPCDPRGKHRHEQHCEENPANTDVEDGEEDGEDEDRVNDTGEDAPGGDQAEGTEADTGTADESGSSASNAPAAIQEAMENPDDLPDEPVPVGIAMQYNAGSYTCETCDTCLGSDQELTDRVNEEGHRGAYIVNRRRC